MKAIQLSFIYSSHLHCLSVTPPQLSKFCLSWDINFLIYTFFIDIIALQIQLILCLQASPSITNPCVRMTSRRAFFSEYMMSNDPFIPHFTLQQQNVVKTWENTNVTCYVLKRKKSVISFSVVYLLTEHRRWVLKKMYTKCVFYFC